MIKRFITSLEIKKLASLLNLSISKDEIDVCTEKLSRILDYISQLVNMDISDVESKLNPSCQINNYSLDEPQPSITRDFMLKNSAKMISEFFQVPEVN